MCLSCVGEEGEEEGEIFGDGEEEEGEVGVSVGEAGDGGFFTSSEGLQHLTAEGQQVWQRLEGMLAASEAAAERQITNGVASE